MKLETIFCGTTWILMNALFVMVAVEPHTLFDRPVAAISAPAPTA